MKSILNFENEYARDHSFPGQLLRSVHWGGGGGLPLQGE